jgi:dTDP-4-amino-4,6-dideoxygalactose transaminase
MEKKLNVTHCVAVSSGTGALMTCLAALGIGSGDEVILPGYTFIASMSAIIYMNAIPVLAEIDESLTIDPDDIERRITKNTKAIMPVHMLGNPCNMDRIMEIAKKHNLYVIEDCCQAAGAVYKGKKTGTIGDMGAFSLNVFKTITAGDGGAVVTNDFNLYERAFAFHDQGHKANRMGLEIGHRSMIGINLRINELTGAIALAQARKLDMILDMLREKKSQLKSLISTAASDKFIFRNINDETGECATLLTMIFKTTELAENFCKALDMATISKSGWHVYSNMEQLLQKKTPSGKGDPFHCTENGRNIKYEVGMLPKTDDILTRAVNISIGVVDKGLGAGFGINILSDNEEIQAVGNRIIDVLKGL